jgi:hypothetical protein
MKRRSAVTIVAICALLPALAPRAADGDPYKTAGGLAVYLGVLPAAMVRGHQTHPEERMHGGIPSGPHAYHVVAAVFNAATGARVEDAKVEARVTPRGLGGETQALEPMQIAGTVTYGNYFTMGGSDPYRVELRITPSGGSPVEVEFTYRHGTQ